MLERVTVPITFFDKLTSSMFPIREHSITLTRLHHWKWVHRNDCQDVVKSASSWESSESGEAGHGCVSVASCQLASSFNVTWGISLYYICDKLTWCDMWHASVFPIFLSNDCFISIFPSHFLRHTTCIHSWPTRLRPRNRGHTAESEIATHWRYTTTTRATTSHLRR